MSKWISGKGECFYLEKSTFPHTIRKGDIQYGFTNKSQ